MQIQRKSNGSAALRIAGRLIFSFPCLLAADGIAALVVGRAYKIPKVCVIEYLMGEDMCRINLS